MSIKNPINSLYAPWIPIKNSYDRLWKVMKSCEKLWKVTDSSYNQLWKVMKSYN